MGACCTSQKHVNLAKYVTGKLALAIDRQSLDKVKDVTVKYLKGKSPYKEPVININDPIFKINQCDMNALGYALYLGATDIFKYLVQEAKAKFSAMNRLYLQLGKRPIDVICELGHFALFEYYLPLYLKNEEVNDDANNEEESEELSIFAKSKTTKSHTQDKSKLVVPYSTMTPVQRIVDKGKFSMLRYVYEYFKDKPENSEFSVSYLDETTGENCGLIACRTGNLDIIRYLYEVCHVDFHILNKRKENAIQIAAVWSKKRKQKKFKDCIKYLVEVIGVDYTYEFEETLLVLEDKSIINYLEEKLQEDGFSVNKGKIDDKYSLSKNRVPPIPDPKLEAKLSKIKGSNFNFTELFREELVESKSEISSISAKYSKSFSMMNNESII
ncbi:unnamed protein product [Blepharisma stoltei]|uniref:Uncharacterized protein n=1 Tax=Blepharisma stoltei TaxID=1481888 RepID=A0AAU9K9F3_9CILI|nr:unnamed protein product [Blepharisma stoltei]